MTMVLALLLVGLLTPMFLVLFSPLPNWLAALIPAVHADLEPADGIVVLGGGSYANGQLSLLSLERAVYGIQLYRRGLGVKIVFSGGASSRRRSMLPWRLYPPASADQVVEMGDARAMEALAIALGVPSRDIMTETASTHTYENIMHVADLLKGNGIRTALLVTSPVHMYRSWLASQKTDVGFVPAPTVSCDQFRHDAIDRVFLFHSVMREFGLLATYKARGWI